MQSAHVPGLRGLRRALLERAVRFAGLVAVGRVFDRRGLFGVFHTSGFFGVLGLKAVSRASVG